MFWRRDPHIERLIDRYLDARRSFSPAQDRAMREHLRSCPSCRRLYDRKLALHRCMLGLEPDQPSGIEMERLSIGVLPRPEIQQERSLSLLKPLAAAAAMLALVVGVVQLTRPPTQAPARDDEYLATRGMDPRRPHEELVGIGVSGVTEGGREYEVVADGRVYLSDYLRFYYTAERESLRYLFVLGLQPGVDPLPYFPLPEEERSVPIRAGDEARSIQLPYETRLAARHRTGPLLVVALFTSEPIDFSDVAMALDDSLWKNGAFPTGSVAFKAALLSRLRLPTEVVMRTVEMTVAPGSKGEHDGP